MQLPKPCCSARTGSQQGNVSDQVEIGRFSNRMTLSIRSAARMREPFLPVYPSESGGTGRLQANYSRLQSGAQPPPACASVNLSGARASKFRTWKSAHLQEKLSMMPEAMSRVSPSGVNALRCDLRDAFLARRAA